MKDLFLDTVEVNDLAEAKQLIKENKEGFLKLFDNSPVCMSMTSTDRIFVRVNKKFIEKFGFTKEEIIGRNAFQIGILDEAEHLKVSTIFREKGRLQNDQVKCITKDGKVVHTVSSIEFVEFSGDSYMMSSFLDITKIIEQQELIERQNKEIIDSINYARLIQNSILPKQSQVEQILPESFVLSKPKNILSGDFYWIKKIDEKVYVSACDCTGHGVPGALISIIGFKLLDKFIGEYKLSKPAEILNQLNREFHATNNELNGVMNEIKDGMDIALCIIDKSTMTIEYAGAYNPIYMVRNNELTKLTVDKIPIHLFTDGVNGKFNNYKMQIEPNDIFYLFSDGYADQFGGPNRKKFRYKNFQELILSVHQLSMSEQKDFFNKTIEEWKSMTDEEQTDDMLIVGFKI